MHFFLFSRMRCCVTGLFRRFAVLSKQAHFGSYVYSFSLYVKKVNYVFIVILFKYSAFISLLKIVLIQHLNESFLCVIRIGSTVITVIFLRYFFTLFLENCYFTVIFRKLLFFYVISQVSLGMHLETNDCSKSKWF